MITPILHRCRCGEEVGYGPLAAPEEIARGTCSACEAGRPPQPSEALLIACREMAAHRAAGRHGAASRVERELAWYQVRERRVAYRAAGMGDVMVPGDVL